MEYYQKLLEILNDLCPETICIFCHQNADPDAVCSAFALSELLSRLISGVKFHYFSDGLNKISKRVVKKLNMVFSKKLNFVEGDLYFLVDTNNLEQLGCFKKVVKERSTPIIIIDHHASHPQGKQISKLYIHDESALAACEIVYKKYKMTPTSSSAYALLMGITYDSKHFILGTPETFQTATALMEFGAKYEEIIDLLRSPLDFSERVARLKAAKRLSIHIINGRLLVLSKVSAFEASAARSLLALGADVAIVAAEKKKTIRISGRAKRGITQETGLHLGNIFQQIGPLLNGVGGGHQNAAACNGSGNLNEGIEEIVTLIRYHLSKK